MPHRMDGPGDPLALACPRCGHGLDGNALAAEARGETRGICSECGLPVEWETLRREALAPRWHVEARRSIGSLPVRAVSTLVRTARPFRFWGAVDLALPLRWRGLAALAVAVAITLHAVGVAAQFAPGAFFWKNVEYLRAGRPTDATSFIVADVALIALSPASGFAGADLLWLARQEAGATDLVTWPLIRLYGSAIAMPFADVLKLRVRSGTGVGFGVGWAKSRGWLVLPPVSWPTIVLSAGAAMLSPLAMLLLPTSLRRARVRPAHFVRMVATGVVLAVPTLAFALALAHFGGEFHQFSLTPTNSWGSLNAHLVLSIGSGAMAAVWVAAAAGRYLRLPNAAAIGLCCAAIGTLLSLHLLAIYHF